jgi:glycosyltransferase involved in cell wall biosynthesis
MWKRLPALGASSSLRRALHAEARAVDLVHAHGLWMMPGMYAADAALAANVPFVLATRGMLSPWAINHSKLKKRVMWYLQQRSALYKARCLHATSDAEREDLRQFGLTMPIAVVPNGIAVPPPQKSTEAAPTERRLLLLSRIDEKKGIENLLRAWRDVEASSPTWNLVICGPGRADYVAALRSLSKALGNKRIEFLPARYGDEKAALLWSVEIFVLPTFEESFGVAIAEALAHGIPVITTRRTPWKGLEETGSGWWIDIGVPPLIAALRTALSKSAEDLRAMGARGREWMARDFSWGPIGEKMRATYEWMLGRETQPSWVETMRSR